MQSTGKAPLEALLVELGADSEHAPSNEEHRQNGGRTYDASGEELQLRDDKPFDKTSISSRVVRTIAFFLFAVLVGAGATLIVFPPVAWLSPGSTTKPPGQSLTAADLQEQLKPIAVDLALMRRSMEQLRSDLDQLARKQDQLTQNMAILQAAQQQVSQTGSTPPPSPKAVAPSPPKTVHVPLPPPRSLQPAAQ